MEFLQPRSNPYGPNIMSEEEVAAFLKQAKYGTLSFINTDGYPDIRPLDFAWDGMYFYFHGSAHKGVKVKSLRLHPQVSINLYKPSNQIGQVRICTHESVIAYGDVEELKGEEAMAALQIFAVSAGLPYKSERDFIEKLLPATSVFRLKPKHMTGKLVHFTTRPEQVRRAIKKVLCTFFDVVIGYDNPDKGYEIYPDKTLLFPDGGLPVKTKKTLYSQGLKELLRQ